MQQCGERRRRLLFGTLLLSALWLQAGRSGLLGERVTRKHYHSRLRQSSSLTNKSQLIGVNEFLLYYIYRLTSEIIKREIRENIIWKKRTPVLKYCCEQGHVFMSLQFVFGNSGSGKSDYLYQSILRKRKGNRRRISFVCPEQFTIRRRSGNSCAASPTMPS